MTLANVLVETTSHNRLSDSKQWQLLENHMPKLPNIAGCALMLGMLLFSSKISAQVDLKMSIQSKKVVYDESGKVRYVPAKTADSGDVVQYRALYLNNEDIPLRDLTIVLPIPTGMAFTGEVFPLSGQASIDDAYYVDMPLYRRVDGKLVKVPYSEYSSLRWNVKLLPAHKVAVVAFNALVK